MKQFTKGHSLDVLNETADYIVTHLRQLPDYQDVKIIFIGGLAVKRSFGNVTVTDVDFLIDTDEDAPTVKAKLRALSPQAFNERAPKFLYFHPDGSKVQVDLIPARFCPFIPSDMAKIKDTHEGTIPCISKANLIAFKIWSCGLRSSFVKKTTDRDHAKTHLESLDRPLHLSSEQKVTVEEGLPDLLRLEEGSEERWWRKSIGLSVW